MWYIINVPYSQPPLSYLGNDSEDIKKTDFQVDIFSIRKFKNCSPCSLNPRGWGKWDVTFRTLLIVSWSFLRWMTFESWRAGPGAGTNIMVDVSDSSHTASWGSLFLFPKTLLSLGLYILHFPPLNAVAHWHCAENVSNSSVYLPLWHKVWTIAHA